MPYIPFNEYFPSLGEQETRAITLLDDRFAPIPAGEYGLIEMFCDEADCDCRRVMFSVASSLEQRIVAVVAYGWESRAFYAQWFGRKNDEVIDEMQGPVLNKASLQASYAPAFLNLIRELLSKDKTYVERIKQHYNLFREKVANGSAQKSDGRRNRMFGSKKHGIKN